MARARARGPLTSSIGSNWKRPGRSWIVDHFSVSSFGPSKESVIGVQPSAWPAAVMSHRRKAMAPRQSVIAPQCPPHRSGAREGWPEARGSVTFGRRQGMGNHMIRGEVRRAVPAIALMALLGLGTDLGHAQALSTVDAARLLARVEAIDGRCRFLDAADHDALKTFAARAEVAAAGEGGPEEATQAVASGRAEGSTGACSGESARLVRSAYASARSAASGLSRRSAAAAAPPEGVPRQPGRRYGAGQLQ